MPFGTALCWAATPTVISRTLSSSQTEAAPTKRWPPPVPSLSPPRDLTGVTLTALALRVCPASLSSVGCPCQNVLLLLKAEQQAMWTARPVPAACQQTPCRFPLGCCERHCVDTGVRAPVRVSASGSRAAHPIPVGAAVISRGTSVPVPAAAAPFPSAGSCVQGHPPTPATASLCKRHHPDPGKPALSGYRALCHQGPRSSPSSDFLFSGISKPAFSRSSLRASLLLQFTREASTSAHTDYVPR